MNNSRSFQDKKQATSAFSLSTTVRPTRPFIPMPEHAIIPSSTDLQASLEHARHLDWSFEHMAITREDLPPEQQYAVNPLREQTTTSSAEHVLQPKAVQSPVRQENTTGLPDQLKAGIENLSGLSLNDVHVYYNSSQPAHVQALAYTQGSAIYVGPGQEKHLAHEAWHVVQQKQGRVQPPSQINTMAVKDDKGLEREADLMGSRAATTSNYLQPVQLASQNSQQWSIAPTQTGVPAIQCKHPEVNPHNSMEYFDADLPGITLIKQSDFARNEFMMPNGTHVFYDDGTPWLDRSCSQPFDVSVLQTNARKSPFTYKIREDIKRSEMLIEDVENIIVNKRPDSELNESRKQKALQEMQNNVIIHPIEITIDAQGKYRLIQGNHRLWAAKQMGYKNIPVICKSVFESNQ